MTLQSNGNCEQPLADISDNNVSSNDHTVCKSVNHKSDRRKCIRRRKQQLQEYKRLRQLIPSVSSVPSHMKVPKVTIINEAVKYIDQLHSQVVERLSQGTLAPHNLILPHNILPSVPSDLTDDQFEPSLELNSLQDAFNTLLNRLSFPITSACTAPPA